LKLQEESLEKTLEHIGIGNAFLSGSPVAQDIRERVDKWSCIKLKSFWMANETITRIKRQPIEWEEIFANYASDRRLISRLY
jgi:hypothetical protein